MRRLLAMAALLAGCGGDPTGFGVNVTVEAGAIGADDRARITTAKLSVSGAESYQKSFDISSAIKTGEVRFRYIPGVQSGQLTLSLDAVDASEAVVANGISAPFDLVAGKAVAARIPLGPPSATDMGDDAAEHGDMAHEAKGQGAPCTTSTECGTAGGCVDGYCCDTTCTEACKACNIGGKEGACSPSPGGMPPVAGHASCGPDAKSTCQRDGMCDGAGACRLWALGTVCQAGSCSSATNMVTSDSTCDGNGACKPGTTITCAPYLCKDASVCWPSCTSGSNECSSGNVCTGTSCGKKPIGSICSSNTECQNGTDGSAHCVDGVCCNTACTGTCQYCALSQSKGTCSLVPANGDPRGVCPAGSNTICSPGGCTGTSTSCKYAPQNTPCSGSCTNNTANNTTCNSSGGCTQSAGMTSCGAYACVVGGGGTQASCDTTCVSDSDCYQPKYACNTATGKCAFALGQVCGSSTDCASAACAPEGICCSRACTGQCEACNSQGICSYVSGAPVSPRAACNSDPAHPVCNGSCSGSSPSCSYPTSSCASSTCAYNNATLYANVTTYACSNGTCTGTQSSCGNYVCNGNVCYTFPCTSDSYCNTIRGYSCKLDPVNLIKMCL